MAGTRGHRRLTLAIVATMALAAVALVADACACVPPTALSGKPCTSDADCELPESAPGAAAIPPHFCQLDRPPNVCLVRPTPGGDEEDAGPADAGADDPDAGQDAGPDAGPDDPDAGPDAGPDEIDECALGT